MELINFLVFLLKASGLIFVIGILINLILDTVIINPIINRRIEMKRIKIMDMLIEKVKNGEDISKFKIDADTLKAEIEEKIED